MRWQKENHHLQIFTQWEFFLSYLEKIHHRFSYYCLMSHWLDVWQVIRQAELQQFKFKISLFTVYYCCAVGWTFFSPYERICFIVFEESTCWGKLVIPFIYVAIVLHMVCLLIFLVEGTIVFCWAWNFNFCEWNISPWILSGFSVSD